MLDRFDCYELCVQSPRHVTSFLRAAHGSEPRVLREDFCGTGAVSRRWIADAGKRGDDARAIAVDIDSEVLTKAIGLARAENVSGGIEFLRGDCLSTGSAADAVGGNTGADVVFVGNFSIGYIHDRGSLLDYIRATRRRIGLGNAGFGGGIFACDLYGGAGAFRLGAIERKHPSRGREVIRYVWRHEAADPRTAMVENSISFRVEVDGEVIQELARAFVYRWRLWSLAELREAMLESGYADVEVFADVNVAPGQQPEPIRTPSELGEDWVVMMVART